MERPPTNELHGNSLSTYSHSLHKLRRLVLDNKPRMTDGYRGKGDLRHEEWPADCHSRGRGQVPLPQRKDQDEPGDHEAERNNCPHYSPTSASGHSFLPVVGTVHFGPAAVLLESLSESSFQIRHSQPEAGTKMLMLQIGYSIHPRPANKTATTTATFSFHLTPRTFWGIRIQRRSSISMCPI